MKIFELLVGTNNKAEGGAIPTNLAELARLVVLVRGSLGITLGVLQLVKLGEGEA